MLSRAVGVRVLVVALTVVGAAVVPDLPPAGVADPWFATLHRLSDCTLSTDVQRAITLWLI
jgi:hypothetical protein